MIVKQCGMYDEVFLFSNEENGEVIGKFSIFSNIPGERPGGHVLNDAFPDSLSLWGVYIDDEYRGNGYGHMLMHDVASELGNRSCWLTVECDNHIAKSLYEKHGFVHIATSILLCGGEDPIHPIDFYAPRYDIMYREV